jgi:hypothetical protein
MSKWEYLGDNKYWLNVNKDRILLSPNMPFQIEDKFDYLVDKRRISAKKIVEENIQNIIPEIPKFQVSEIPTCPEIPVLDFSLDPVKLTPDCPLEQTTSVGKAPYIGLRLIQGEGGVEKRGRGRPRKVK